MKRLFFLCLIFTGCIAEKKQTHSTPEVPVMESSSEPKLSRREQITDLGKEITYTCNFGKIFSGAMLVYEFEFTNPLDEEIKAKNVIKSCGCSSIKKQDGSDYAVGDTLTPGETAKIIVSVDTKKKHGNFNTVPMLIWDGKETDIKVNFIVQGIGVAPILSKPERLEFSDEDVRNKIEKEVFVTVMNPDVLMGSVFFDLSHSGFKIVDKKIDGKKIKLKIIASKSDNESMYSTLQFKAKVNEKLQNKINSEIVSGNVCYLTSVQKVDLEIKPSLIFVKTDEPVATLLVKKQGLDKNGIKDVYCDSLKSSWQVRSAGKNTVVLSVKLDVNDVQKENFDLYVKLKDGEEKKLSLFVR